MAIPSGISAQLGVIDEVYTNEVQSISGTASGVFTLVFEGATTATIALNAAAATVQAALEALPSIGTGGVVCAGGALPAAVSVTFSGNNVRARNVDLLTVGNGATGLTITTTTPGKGYGDFLAPTRFYELRDEGIAKETEYIRSAAIRTGKRVMRTARTAVNVKGAGGQWSKDVVTKGDGLLFKHMFGSSVITTPSGATLTRDHTYVLASLCDISMVVQKGIPRQECVANNVDAFSYTGGKITGWSLSCDVDGLLGLSLTQDFMQEDTAQTLAAASYAASLEVLSFIGATITIGGSNHPVRAFSLEGTNPVKTDRFYLRTSGLKKQPLQNDLVSVTGSVEMDYDTLGRSVYDRFVSGTTAAFTALFEGSIIEAGGAPTVNPKYGLLITIPAVRFTGTTPQVNGLDVTNVPLPFELLDDDTNEPITVRYRTTDAAD